MEKILKRLKWKEELEMWSPIAFDEMEFFKNLKKRKFLHFGFFHCKLFDPLKEKDRLIPFFQIFEFVVLQRGSLD
jgi:hypothetical protein